MKEIRAIREVINGIQIPATRDYFPMDITDELEDMRQGKACIIEKLNAAEETYNVAVEDALSGNCSAPKTTLAAIEKASKPLVALAIETLNLASAILGIQSRVKTTHSAAADKFRELEQKRAAVVRDLIMKTTQVEMSIRTAVHGDPERLKFKQATDGCTNLSRDNTDVKRAEADIGAAKQVLTTLLA